MSKIAFVFPGQGAQYPGMGKSLYESSKAAKDVFDKAESAVPGILDLIFNGSQEELKETKNAQPAIYITEMAAAAALKEKGITCEGTAGFSLGELSAVCEAGVFTFEETLSVVLERGKLMQHAAEEHPAFMVAVLKLTPEQMKEICEQFTAVYPVNYNCPGQISVSGIKEEQKAFMAAVKEAGGRALPLKVSGGFHSPFMEEASTAFTELLKDYEPKQESILLYSNLTGSLYPENKRETLGKQISNPVLWESIIRNMILEGFDTFIEVGPGNTLRGMIQRIDPSVTCMGCLEE